MFNNTDAAAFRLDSHFFLWLGWLDHPDTHPSPDKWPKQAEDQSKNDLPEGNWRVEYAGQTADHSKDSDEYKEAERIVEAYLQGN